MRTWSAAVCVIVLLAGCASTATMRTAPLSEGKTRVFNAGYDKVLSVARAAVAEAGFAIAEVTKLDDRTTAIIGQNAGGFGSYGERVRVAVTGRSDSTTAVIVLTRKKLATNLFAKGDWSDVIFTLMETRMKVNTP